jgi:hypothetical protein
MIRIEKVPRTFFEDEQILKDIIVGSREIQD